MMEEKFLKTIKENSLVVAQDKVLVCVSGGPDSVCLLSLFNKYKKALNCSVFVAHLDHGLRGKQGASDAVFVEQLCKKTKVPFFQRRVDAKDFAGKNKLSIEDAGRKLRYGFFEDVAEEISATKIALGHNADDNVETFLMRVIRGSGARGLIGIPITRGKIIRPLLSIWRSEIESYLRSKKIRARTDLSNFSTKYLRNRIRHKILPELKKLNPRLKEAISNTIDLLSADFKYLRSISEKAFNKTILKRESGSIKLDAQKLIMLPDSILRNVIRIGIEDVKGDLDEINFKHIADIISKLEEDRDFELHLPQGIFILQKGDELIITSEAAKIPEKISFCYKLDIPGKVKIKEAGCLISASVLKSISGRAIKIKNKNQALIDAKIAGEKFVIRSRREGDRFSPLGIGGSKKLKDFFIDEKVPKENRDLTPIVEGKNGIVWIAGHRIDDRAKITSRTSKVISLKLERIK